MKLQRLLSLTRQAVDDYRLIQSGDKIAIGISGGKDSLTLFICFTGFAGFTRNHLNFVLLQLIWAFRRFSPEVSNRLSPTLSFGCGCI